MKKLLYKKLSRRAALTMAAAAASAIYLTKENRFNQVISKSLSSNEELAPWDRVLEQTPVRKRNLVELVNKIIPKDQNGPSAGELGVPDFLDEWVSAPFPEQQKDLLLFQKGLDQVENFSLTKYNKTFSEITSNQKNDILDKISKKDKEAKHIYKFFKRLRRLIGFGYYTDVDYGWKAVGYVGNEPQSSYDGPPKKVLNQVLKSAEISQNEYQLYIKEWEGLS